MSEYRWDRRIEAVRRLGAVTKNEAAEMGDINRERIYETAREQIADDIKRDADKNRKRSFADLITKKG